MLTTYGRTEEEDSRYQVVGNNFVREQVVWLGSKIAGFGLVKVSREINRIGRNPSQLLLLAELTHITDQRLLKSRKCTIAARVIMALIGSFSSIFIDYYTNVPKVIPGSPSFIPGLFPSNSAFNLSLCATNMLVNAAVSGWLFSEVMEQLSWKLKIRVKGPLRGVHCPERLGIAAMLLLSLLNGALCLAPELTRHLDSYGVINAVANSISAIFYSHFAYGWVLSRLLECRGNSNAKSMELVAKMQFLARDSGYLAGTDISSWENGEDFLKAIVQCEDFELASTRLKLTQRVVAGLISAVGFAVAIPGLYFSVNLDGSHYSPLQWITNILSLMWNAVICYVAASAFVQAVAHTCSASAERSLIEQFFPRLIAGMSIPFFLVAAAAGMFDLMLSYPPDQGGLGLAGYGSEDNATTGSSFPQQPDGVFAVNAIVSGGVTFLLGMFAFREWLKIFLRCSVAAKTNTQQQTQLNLSLNLLSAADHIQSVSPDEVADAVKHCVTSS